MYVRGYEEPSVSTIQAKMLPARIEGLDVRTMDNMKCVATLSTRIDGHTAMGTCYGKLRVMSC